MIEWQSFDWPTFGALAEAAATLMVGVAAVVGATRVGLKQAGISQRQADIAEQQTAILAQQVTLEEKRIAFDLYDRRYRIYEITARFILESMSGEKSQHPLCKMPFSWRRWKANSSLPQTLARSWMSFGENATPITL